MYDIFNVKSTKISTDSTLKIVATSSKSHPSWCDSA